VPSPKYILTTAVIALLTMLGVERYRAQKG
jgi:hypothetical protein